MQESILSTKVIPTVNSRGSTIMRDRGMVPSTFEDFLARAVTAKRAIDEAVSNPRPKRTPTLC